MTLGRVAVLKPDHLGDLVLASPAIKILRERLGVFDLFVHPANLKLAEFLFGGEMPSLRSMLLPHLDKSGGTPEVPELQGYDTVISLRHDSILNLDWLRSRASVVFLVEHSGLRHESEVHRETLSRLVGDYEPVDAFGVAGFSRKRSALKRVGLCVAAGHSSNQWSLVRWLELGHRLRAEGHELSLIGGPQETRELTVLQGALGLKEREVFRGGRDIRDFLKRISSLDLVVATDSGAAHLCSLVVPLLSIFGPSALRRFRPLGREHRAISLELNCSPCLQFSRTEINLCVSRECLNSISVDRVADEVRRFAPNGAITAAFTRGLDDR